MTSKTSKTATLTPKRKYTKKMIEACKRRIRQYEEMIEKGRVTRWFEAYGILLCTICFAASTDCRECILDGHCIDNTDTGRALYARNLKVGEPLTDDDIEAIKARLAYLKRLFKREGVI